MKFIPKAIEIIILFGLMVCMAFGNVLPNGDNSSSLTEPSKDKLLRNAIDQLYKETMIRLEIEKKLRLLTNEISNLKTEGEHNGPSTQENKGDILQSNYLEKHVCITFPSLVEKFGYGFYAYVSSDLTNPGGQHTIVYDDIKTNFDNAYNQYTGIFTVPKDGLYSFTWVTRVQCSEAYTSELIVNKDVLGSTYAYCGWNTVTGNAIVKVTKGDAVFIRTRPGVGKGMIRSNEYGRTSFSGFMIN
ncbi:uncharacterized protein LOC133187616 [Saccostrea echinata]|uniref:uncharacterized protein LOC133187616 n=1 Tax=Saccostrea echinata TaxID=191078 RepID=UPI002A82D92B|nr:uncharacterized protein LOC133187616 [Saccostrea echinata]